MAVPTSRSRKAPTLRPRPKRSERAARSRDGGRASAPGRGSRESLHHLVIDRLRAMIVDGALRPGARLREVQLSRALGVSRTPLREAFKILASEGLIALRPHRGGIVAPIDPDEIADVFEVMGELEHLAGRLLCERISNAEIAVLAQQHDRLIEFHRDGNRAEYFALNQEIHDRIVAFTRNAALLAIYRGFAGKIRRARAQANYDGARWAESVREHAAIMRAIKGRQAATLATRLRDHNAATGRAVIRQMKAPPTD